MWNHSTLHILNISINYWQLKKTKKSVRKPCACACLVCLCVRVCMYVWEINTSVADWYGLIQPFLKRCLFWHCSPSYQQQDLLKSFGNSWRSSMLLLSSWHSVWPSPPPRGWSRTFLQAALDQSSPSFFLFFLWSLICLHLMSYSLQLSMKISTG